MTFDKKNHFYNNFMKIQNLTFFAILKSKIDEKFHRMVILPLVFNLSFRGLNTLKKNIIIVYNEESKKILKKFFQIQLLIESG
jgi:hypothetical protein